MKKTTLHKVVRKIKAMVKLSQNERNRLITVACENSDKRSKQ